MPIIKISNTQGLDLYVNPLAQESNGLLRAVNTTSDPFGAKKKRPGYVTFLGTAEGSAVKDLFSWTKDDGALFLYRNSGTQLLYSVEGTGAWTAVNNGSVAGTAHVGYTVLGDTLILGDGAGSTRHTTNGTALTNTSLAPVAQDFVQFQNRIYAIGTASDMFYSTTGDATNWSTSGTSDSSSIRIPGEGKLLAIRKDSDRVITTKTSGQEYRWDGFNLVDMTTTLGPSSPYSVAKIEDLSTYLNRNGILTTSGDRPRLISNAIQPQIYNDADSGIAGSTFDTAPGVVHRYDYFLSVGTIAEDITNYTIQDAIIKYNYQKNEFLNFKFANFPTAWCSFKDTNKVQQLIFGDATGQVYKYGGTATTDNGAAIESVIQGVIHGNTLLNKQFKTYRLSFNPGCQAKVQFAVANTFVKGALDWFDVASASSGVLEGRFPSEKSEGKFLFYRIYESSKTARFDWYSMEIELEVKASS